MEDRIAALEKPQGRPVGFQRWSDLLFLHWEIEAASIQETLPDGLYVDTFEGKAYLGIVPFFMEKIRPVFLPPVPWLSWFLELNVRTYVYDGEGRPGVFFYSLDCNQPVAVALGRRFFHLPYFRAKMSATRDGALIDYHGKRQGALNAACRYTWLIEEEKHEAAVGSLEFFLVERYRLFTSTGKSGLVHHRPYRIGNADLRAMTTLPAEQAGFELRGLPVSILCADAVDVQVFALGRESKR